MNVAATEPSTSEEIVIPNFAPSDSATLLFSIVSPSAPDKKPRAAAVAPKPRYLLASGEQDSFCWILGLLGRSVYPTSRKYTQPVERGKISRKSVKVFLTFHLTSGVTAATCFASLAAFMLLNQGMSIDSS